MTKINTAKHKTKEDFNILKNMQIFGYRQKTPRSISMNWHLRLYTNAFTDNVKLRYINIRMDSTV
jgi:hypothetical protein